MPRVVENLSVEDHCAAIVAHVGELKAKAVGPLTPAQIASILAMFEALGPAALSLLQSFIPALTPPAGK